MGAAVPASLAGGQRAGPIHQVRDDEVLVDLPGVARVLVRAGDVVGIESAPDVGEADIAWLLEGHVRHITALQGGQLALRASAVVIDGRAVAICALGALGASAVAAGLACRGHAVLADGWLPVTGPNLLAQAVTDELALWPDVAQLVGRFPDDGRPVRPRLTKARHRFARGAPAPLVAIILLRRYEWEDDVGLETVGGGSAVEEVSRFIALDNLIVPMGLEAQAFLWTASLVSSCAVHVLELDRNRPGVDQPARAIERLLRR